MIEKIVLPFENVIRYESFILVGVLMTVGTLLKLLGVIDISSDWFWLLAGVGLTVEGAISMIKQRRFDRKFKVIDRNGVELNGNKL
jgi:hypothetical protein